MNLVNAILKEILSLFVDDGSLALQALVLVLAIAALVKGLVLAPLAGGCLLIVGCLVILAFSLRRKLRR
jgi:hypothetical protein